MTFLQGTKGFRSAPPSCQYIQRNGCGTGSCLPVPPGAPGFAALLRPLPEVLVGEHGARQNAEGDQENQSEAFNISVHVAASRACPDMCEAVIEAGQKDLCCWTSPAWQPVFGWAICHRHKSRIWPEDGCGILHCATKALCRPAYKFQFKSKGASPQP